MRGVLDAGRAPAAWWKQADAEGKLMERVTGRAVTPLLVVSGGWTKHRFARRRGVLVLHERMLAGFLRRQSAVLPAAEADAVHAQLVAALSAPRSR